MRDSAALAPLVAGAVRAGDVLMVKGSAGSRMAAVVDAVAALDTGGDSDSNSRTTPDETPGEIPDDRAQRAARQG